MFRETPFKLNAQMELVTANAKIAMPAKTATIVIENRPSASAFKDLYENDSFSAILGFHPCD